MPGRVVSLLATGAIVYALACVLYVMITRMGNVPTPFSDSLTAEQIAIKKKSAYTRGTIFVASITLASGLVCMWQPMS